MNDIQNPNPSPNQSPNPSPSPDMNPNPIPTPNLDFEALGLTPDEIELIQNPYSDYPVVLANLLSNVSDVMELWSQVLNEIEQKDPILKV